MQFQVEGCLNLGKQNWAAVSSTLTGSFWHGGLSVFSSEGTGPMIGRYQWSNEKGGMTCLSKVVPNQTLLITGSMDGSISLHPLDSLFEKTTASVETYISHNAPVSAVAGDPKDSSRFVSAGWDNKINLHTLGGNNHCQPGNSFLAHYKKIHALSWVSESTFLSAGDDGDIKLWDIRDSKLSHQPSLTIASFGPAFCLSVSQSNIAVGHEDGVYIYDLKNATASHTAKHHLGIPVKALEFNPKTNSHIAIGADDGSTCVLELKDAALNIFYNGPKHRDFVRGVCWDEAGDCYVSGGWAINPDKSLDVVIHDISL